MADPYIDQFETQAYGPFSINQIDNSVLGLMPTFDDALKAASKILDEATIKMGDILGETKSLAGVTYKAVSETGEDPVASARDLLEQLCDYASSRKKLGKDGARELAKEVLNGDSVSLMRRRRPVKLAGKLSHAITTVESNRAAFQPETDEWLADLNNTHTALLRLTDQVKKAKLLRQDMTPEVRAAYQDWSRAYLATKRLVEGVLLFADKAWMMPDIFDDMAEVHKVSGVSDGPAPSDPDRSSTPDPVPSTPADIPSEPEPE
jgi:hypothetical protein